MMVQYTLRRSTMPPRFPNQIREYRIRAGLTQRRLAEMIGHGRSIVSAWERGRFLPSLPNVFRLARTLGTLAESLYVDLYSPRQQKEAGDNSENA